MHEQEKMLENNGNNNNGKMLDSSYQSYWHYSTLFSKNILYYKYTLINTVCWEICQKVKLYYNIEKKIYSQILQKMNFHYWYHRSSDIVIIL